jgi:hypothetical protein
MNWGFETFIVDGRFIHNLVVPLWSYANSYLNLVIVCS